MKTKVIPFDLETAKKIQACEIDGSIKTRDGKHEMRIICYDSTAKYCGKTQPIIAQDTEDCESIHTYFEDGYYIDSEGNAKDLVLEVPDDEPQFKPFDKVLVRDFDDKEWICALFSHKTKEGYYASTIFWNQCIPYEGHEYLVGTTDKPKED